MKIIFIASAAYTIYLMMNDFKPTHDPNIDTFKVQYLIGGSAILALLFPSRWIPSEVFDPLISVGGTGGQISQLLEIAVPARVLVVLATAVFFLPWGKSLAVLESLQVLN